MISAKEAFDKSKYSSDINELKRKIEKKIVQATEEGKFKCCVQMRVDTSVYIRHEIKNWLEDLNYRVDIPGIVHREGVRSDQDIYYQDIIISWQL